MNLEAKLIAAFVYAIKLFLFVSIIIAISLTLWNYYYDKKLKGRIIDFVKKKSEKELFLWSILMGALSMGSATFWYPILERVREDAKIKDRYIATFIFARAIKPLLIPLQIALLGWKITLFMNIYLLLISPLAGILTEELEKLL